MQVEPVESQIKHCAPDLGRKAMPNVVLAYAPANFTLLRAETADVKDCFTDEIAGRLGDGRQEKSVRGSFSWSESQRSAIALIDSSVGGSIGTSRQYCSTFI